MMEGLAISSMTSVLRDEIRVGMSEGCEKLKKRRGKFREIARSLKNWGNFVRGFCPLLSF